MIGPFIHNKDPMYAKAGGLYLWFYGTSFNVGFLEVFFWVKTRNSSWRHSRHRLILPSLSKKFSCGC